MPVRGSLSPAKLFGLAKLALAAGMDVNKPHPKQPCWPLAAAVQAKTPELVQLLLELGADVLHKSPHLDVSGFYGPMFEATNVTPSPAILRLLLEYGAEPDERACGCNEKYTLLQHLICGELIESFGAAPVLECMKLLISAGADVDAVDVVQGDSTLKIISSKLIHGDVAARRKKHEHEYVAAAQILLAAGADPDACSQVPCVGLPAPRVLDDAIEGHFCDVCSFDPVPVLFEALVEAGADIQPHPSGKGDRSYLYTLVIDRSRPTINAFNPIYSQLLKRCLELGANPHAVIPDLRPVDAADGTQRDGLGPNPLHSALFRSNHDAAQALIDAGACVDSLSPLLEKCRFNKFVRPLMLATLLNDTDSVRMLLKAKAKPALVDEDCIRDGVCNGLLTLACSHGDIGIIQLLLDAGLHFRKPSYSPGCSHFGLQSQAYSHTGCLNIELRSPGIGVFDDALLDAISWQDGPFVQLLLDRGVPIPELEPGVSLLHFAVNSRLGAPDVVGTLLDHPRTSKTLRPFLNARDIGTGATLLFTACHNNLAFSIKDLLSAGADANIVTHAGASPLQALKAHKPRMSLPGQEMFGLWHLAVALLQHETLDAVAGAKGCALPPPRTDWPWDGTAEVDGESAQVGLSPLVPATLFLAAARNYRLFAA